MLSHHENLVHHFRRSLMSEPRHLTDVDACVDHILAELGNEIVLGLPLGLGKPPQLVNALYRRAKADPGIRLTILTALSLQVPSAGSGLQKALLQPFFDRIFGSYPGLDYMCDIQRGCVPVNIDVHEFFFKSGEMLGNDYAQRRYISTNYTHAPRDIQSHGVNLVAQLIAHRRRDGRDEYSLSCNPEVSLDMLPIIESRRAAGERILAVGQIHPDLPFMVNDALVEASHFDILLDSPSLATTLFAPPHQPVSTVDHMIGLHASALIRDGSTLQVGIGSLGDAIVHALEMRHQDNPAWNQLVDELGMHDKFGTALSEVGDAGRFGLGLHGSSEMFVPGFARLMQAGILKRKVYDNLGLQTVVRKYRRDDRVDEALFDQLLAERVITDPLSAQDVDVLVRYGIFRAGTRLQDDVIVTPGGQRLDPDIADPRARRRLLEACLGDRLRGGVVMQGGFFVGSHDFYAYLRDLDDEARSAINMTAISVVNALYGNEALKRAQREDARFINTVFMVHLLGSATSDGLDTGQVVSGVGGQYNFVAQAHELQCARSVLMVKSTRTKGDVTQSNIVFKYGHVTIPRHLRDIYVSEYGIADVRGRPDEQVIAALLNIADSRFQPELLEQARAAGKLAKDYEIPEPFRYNTPERLEAVAKPWRARGWFKTFPAGTDFTPDELRLAKALKAVAVRAAQPSTLPGTLWRMRKGGMPDTDLDRLLARVGLAAPATLRDRIARQYLLEELVRK
jgi:acyl-CoA hydrolase